MHDLAAGGGKKRAGRRSIENLNERSNLLAIRRCEV